MNFWDVIDIINRIADNRGGREIAGGMPSGPVGPAGGLRHLTPPYSVPDGLPSGYPLPGESDEQDTVFVEPVPGSVVYCDLGLGFIEHSGIYIGDGRIVALERDGRIVSRTPEGFMKDTPAFCIYVSCSGDHAVGSSEAAERAREKIGSRRNYNVAPDNCHHFSYGCLSGNFESRVVMLRQLKAECSVTLDADRWCPWDYGNARELLSKKRVILKAAGEMVRRIRNRPL